MREIVLNRMEQEINAYREVLVSGQMNAEQIVEQSYQLVVKQGMYCVFKNCNADKVSMDEWNWLNGQEYILDYLYDLWMNDDTDLSDEFAEIILSEMNLDMGVHKNE